MTSGGKWPPRWLPTRAKAPADDEPLLRSYLGLEDDGADQLPAEAPFPVRPAQAPLPVRDAAPTGVRPPFPAPTVARSSAPMPALAAPSFPSPAAEQPMPDFPPAAAPVMSPPKAPGAALAPRTAGQRRTATRQRSHMRAVIGDQLGAPALLCEFSGCTSRYTHPEALGEVDLRDWAIAAGWQYDVIGRLACPSCVRHAPTFWGRRLPAPGGDGERGALRAERADR